MTTSTNGSKTTTAKATTTKATTKAGTAKASATKSGDRVAVDTRVDARGRRFDARGAVDARTLRPLYAYAGAASLAVARAKELADSGYRLQDVQERVSKASESFRSQRPSLRTLPQDVRATVDELPGRARSVYADLVSRGEQLVETVRTNPSTRTVVGEARATAEQLKGVTAHAKRAVKAGERVAEETVDELG